MPRGADARQRGGETILLVEDEEQVRSLVREILTPEGYTVLDAASPEEALYRSEAYPGPIHLLLTDVVMLEISGWRLALRLMETRPALRVLYMSGYTDDAVGQPGVRDPAQTLILKPFSPETLARKVREILDAPGV